MIAFQNSSDHDGLEITCTEFPCYSITGLEPVTQPGWQDPAIYGNDNLSYFG